MNKKLIVAVAALPVAVLFALAPIASAGASESVTFMTSESIGDNAGSFTASGAVTETSGTFTAVLIAFGAVPSPMVGTGHYLVVFSGEKGSFTVRVQAVFRPTDNPAVYVDVGRWVIVGGSGVYAGLHGVGTLAGVVDFVTGTATGTWEGAIHSS